MHEAAATPAWVLIAYLIAGVCFILALRGLSSPDSSRRGNRLGMVGMAIAVVTTLATHDARLAGRNRRSPSPSAARSAWSPRGDPDDRDAATGGGLPQLVGMAAVLVGAAAFLNPGGIRDRSMPIGR